MNVFYRVYQGFKHDMKSDMINPGSLLTTFEVRNILGVARAEAKSDLCLISNPQTKFSTDGS